MKQRSHGKRSRRDPRLCKNISPEQLGELAGRVRYEPSPRHKKTPTEYNLTPSVLRGTLCEDSRVFKSGKPSTKLKKAKTLLRGGIKGGLVSEQWDGEFPKRIWAVTDDGEPFEARLENREQGIYHGFPLLDDSTGDSIVEAAAKLSGKRGMCKQETDDEC